MLLWLIAGLALGWLVEWIIDWLYWRRTVLVYTPAADYTLRLELEQARLQIATYDKQMRLLEAKGFPIFPDNTSATLSNASQQAYTPSVKMIDEPITDKQSLTYSVASGD